MILFQTSVRVPGGVVRRLGTELKYLLLNDITQNNDFSSKELHNIRKSMEKVVDEFSNSQKKSCDGWELDQSVAYTIADHLRRGKRINAIRDFRSATGAGLKESKDFLDRFGTGEIGSVEFIASFV